MSLMFAGVGGEDRVARPRPKRGAARSRCWATAQHGIWGPLAGDPQARRTGRGPGDPRRRGRAFRHGAGGGAAWRRRRSASGSLRWALMMVRGGDGARRPPLPRRLRFMRVATASTGYLRRRPPPSRRQHSPRRAPSNTAVATSEHLRPWSARDVVIIDSRLCVATTTGLPYLRAARMMRFAGRGTFSSGSRRRGRRAPPSARRKPSYLSRRARPGLLRSWNMIRARAAAILAHFPANGFLRAAARRKTRHPVDAGGDAGLQSADPCPSCRDRDFGIRQRHALAIRHPAADDELSVSAGSASIPRLEPHLAVSSSSVVTRSDRSRISDAQIHPRRVAGPLSESRVNLAPSPARRRRPSIRHAQLRPLQVGENADRPAEILFTLAMVSDQLAHPVMRGVAHYDAEHVRARANSLPIISLDEEAGPRVARILTFR